jgi:arylsulfatase A-like enzyme
MQGAIDKGVVPESATAVNTEAGVKPWADLDDTERAFETKKMQVYAAMVDRLDENVGRLLEALRQRGDLENTVIVFIADNGAEAHPMERYATNPTWIPANFDNSVDSIGSKRSYVALGPSWARATAAPFRASKSKISEGGIRVPAFVSIHGQAPAIDASFMRGMDLAPTFMELAGGTVPADMMGRPLLDRWKGGQPAYSEHEIVAAETYGRRMAQRGTWKVLLQDAPYGSGDWQLYDLAQDLGEQHDLSDEYPQLRQNLIDAWADYAAEVGVVDPEIPIRY